jgi:hypothetical protein
LQRAADNTGSRVFARDDKHEVSIFVIPALFFVIPALFFVIPALFFVTPALSRDPQRTADLCKGRQTTLDPGSSPGMTNTTNWMTDQKLHPKAAKKSEDYPNWGLFVFVFDDIFKFQSLKPSKKETNLTSINMSILRFKASKS